MTTPKGREIIVRMWLYNIFYVFACRYRLNHSDLIQVTSLSVSQMLPLSEPARSVCTDLLVCVKHPVCARNDRNISTLPPISLFSARRAVVDLLWTEFPLQALQDVPQSITPQHLILTCRRHLFGVRQVQPTSIAQFWAAFAVLFWPDTWLHSELKKKWTHLISCELGSHVAF